MISLDGWRLIQVFISPRYAVFEVEMHMTDNRLRCTCPGWQRRKSCKHTEYITEHTDPSLATYATTLWRQPSVEETDSAVKSPESYRQFILTFGKIEVL